VDVSREDTRALKAGTVRVITPASDAKDDATSTLRGHVQLVTAAAAGRHNAPDAAAPASATAGDRAEVVGIRPRAEKEAVHGGEAVLKRRLLREVAGAQPNPVRDTSPLVESCQDATMH
jgi:hypothetical protein